MKISAMTTLIVSSILLLAIMGCTSGENTDNLDKINVNKTIISQGLSLQEDNITQEPQPVNLYFKGGDGGELRVEVPEGNATGEVACTGSNTPRMLGTPVGTWTSPAIRSPVTVDVLFSCSVWAKSEQGANNVHFHLYIRANGDDVADIWTNSQSLSSTPREFTGDDTAEGEIQLNEGDTFEVEIIYFADPQFFIGPAPDSTMLVDGVECDTHLTITAAPISINVEKPLVTENFVAFIATFTDAFASTKINAYLTVLGTMDIIHISDPAFSLGVNGSLVTWIWDYKADKAKDGDYTITVSLCYDEENEFLATANYVIEFPRPPEERTPWDVIMEYLPIIIIVIVVIVAVVAFKVIKNRKEAKAST